MKPTRGPYRYTEGGIIDVPHIRGLEIADVYGAHDTDDRGPEDTEEACANARLLAASWDMQEAIREAVIDLGRLADKDYDIEPSSLGEIADDLLSTLPLGE
jgi:hypothetical protein